MLQLQIKQGNGLCSCKLAPIAGLELSLSECHVSHNKVIGLCNEVLLACRHVRLHQALILTCSSLSYHLLDLAGAMHRGWSSTLCVPNGVVGILNRTIDW